MTTRSSVYLQIARVQMPQAFNGLKYMCARCGAVEQTMCVEAGDDGFDWDP